MSVGFNPKLLTELSNKFGNYVATETHCVGKYNMGLFDWNITPNLQEVRKDFYYAFSWSAYLVKFKHESNQGEFWSSV